MLKRVKRWFLLRALGYRRRRRDVLEAEEIETALAVSGEDRLYRSVRQLLQEQIDYAQEQVSAPEVAKEPMVMAHCAGGIEWLRQFDAFLELSRERACEKVKRHDEEG